MKKLIPLLFLLLSPVAASANAGYYLQGEGGIVAATPRSDLSHSFIPLSGGAGGRISGGYLWGDNNFNYGLESGIFYAPHVTEEGDNYFILGTEDMKYSIVNVDLLGVLKYTFNNGIALFTKGGFAYSHQHVKVTDTTTLFNGTTTDTYDGSGSKIAPDAAIGIGYQFNPNIEMDLTANTVFISHGSASNPASPNGSLMLGLTYHFA